MTTRIRAAKIAATAACALGTLPALHGTAAAATISLAGTAAPADTAATAAGTVSASQQESVQLWLTPDLAGATQFADAVSTPGNTEYHRYLSPAQYTAQFGASPSQAQAVSSWLTAQGLTGVSVSPQRDYVSATGTAAQINHAFDVQMTRYQVSTGGKHITVQANNQPFSVPGVLSGDVLSVTGLNSTPATTYHTASTPRAATSSAPAGCSHYWGQHLKALKVPYNGVTQSPVAVCGYSAQQLRDASSLPPTATGAGTTIALIEDGAPNQMQQTLTQYAATNGLPAPTPDQLQQDNLANTAAKCGNPFDIEEQLDAEAAYATAPSADLLMVEGDACNTQLQGIQPLFDAESTVLAGNGSAPSASIESNSWGITGGESFPATYTNTAHAIDLRAAAEGVTMLYSAGDNPGVPIPASDPYATAVGGTTVGIDQTGARMFETGWSNSIAQISGGAWVNKGIGRDASGGGTSLLYPQPSYQHAVVPASMSTTNQGAVDRTVPDISADADPDSGILEGIIAPAHGHPQYQTFSDGGTSLASPLLAGMIADAEQGQPTSLGFLNPLLYTLAGTPAFNDPTPVTPASPLLEQTAFLPSQITDGRPELVQNDSQGPSFAAYTGQITAPGYDTMTGLGTPNGSAFILALRTAN